MTNLTAGIARTERYTLQSLHWGLWMIPLLLVIYAFGMHRKPELIGVGIGSILASLVALWAGLVVLHTGLRLGGDLGPSGWDRLFLAPDRQRLGTVVWVAGSVLTCALASFLIPPVPDGIWFVDPLLMSILAASLAYPVFGLTRGRAACYATAVGLAVICVAAAPVSQTVVGRIALAIPTVVWTAMWVGMNSMLLNMLRTTKELDRLRHSSARLAVAEERLRFSRDLHDVLGRTLSAVALKAELGAAQADRGQPEAAATMREVQTIATGALDELRGLVRGYRETDLASELAGARSLLESAGITVSTIVEAGPLPPAVARCLAWVVREGTTNVLRHASATTVQLALTRDATGVTVTITNDGASADPPAAGSGLAGLSERLDEVGGTLSSRPRNGHWILTARVDADALARLDTAGSQS